MKLILFGLALLHFALAQVSGPKTAFYEELNWRRGRHAENKSIANMLFMRYDASLEEILKAEVEKYGDKCPPQMIVRKENVEIFLNTAHNNTMRDLFTMIPGRTRIATFSPKGSDRYSFNGVVDVPIAQPIYGQPASKCPAGRQPHHRLSRVCALPDEQDPPRRRRDTSFNSMLDTEKLKDKVTDIIEDAIGKISEYVQDEEIIEGAVETMIQAAGDTIAPFAYARKSASGSHENLQTREELQEKIDFGMKAIKTQEAILDWAQKRADKMAADNERLIDDVKATLSFLRKKLKGDTKDLEMLNNSSVESPEVEGPENAQSPDDEVNKSKYRKIEEIVKSPVLGSIFRR